MRNLANIPSAAPVNPIIIPDDTCPRSYELMSNPMLAMDGFTYDKTSLDRTFNSDINRDKDQVRSPGNSSMMGKSYFPNYAVRQSLEKYIQDPYSKVSLRETNSMFLQKGDQDGHQGEQG